MTQHEFDPLAHEQMVRNLHDESQARIARLALFEEMMVYVDQGQCTFDEAVAQYKHDLEIGSE